MKRTPEPSLQAPEGAADVLRCCLCHRRAAQALGLYCGPVCRSCLEAVAGQGTMDELSALLCAAILTDDTL